jgi:maltose alpha-D-glucosyltransferase/alpha-amylase
MHMMFNFQVNQHLFYALRRPYQPLVKAMKAASRDTATAQVVSSSQSRRLDQGD